MAKFYRGTSVVFLLASVVFNTACSSNLTRFDVINMLKSDKLQITRAEVADQGSGEGASVVGPGGHYLGKVTVGGAYLRRNTRESSPGVHVSGGAKASGGHSLSAGLHGNMRATR